MDNGCSAPTKTDNGIMRFGAQDNAIMRFGAQDNGIMKVPISHEGTLPKVWAVEPADVRAVEPTQVRAIEPTDVWAVGPAEPAFPSFCHHNGGKTNGGPFDGCLARIRTDRIWPHRRCRRWWKTMVGTWWHWDERPRPTGAARQGPCLRRPDEG